MRPIYLDHSATTPLRDEVREAMRPVLQEHFGNPSSPHAWGRRASGHLETARGRVAAALGARHDEIYFVRGGTESDNMAILGRAAAVGASGGLERVVVTAIEHRAVLEAAAQVKTRGGDSAVLSVGCDGSIDPAALEEVLEPEPAVVSVMTVNNEVGMRLPVEQIAERLRSTTVSFHTDAVQAVGKVPVRVDAVPVDLLSLTGHKIYGPKGTGVLFVRRGVEVAPLLFGGGQERGLRSGTEDVAGAVGVSVAVELAVQEQPSESPRLSALRDALQSLLTDGLPDVRVHAAEARRAPHILNVGVPDMDAQLLLAGLDMAEIAVSAGSACASGGHAGSHVLEALYGPLAGMAALRFSLGRTTTEEDVARAAQSTVAVVTNLRKRAAAR